jgi:MraZ protein
MFTGTFDYRLDAKGRLPIPAPFRKVLERAGQKTVVATLLDNCLAIYPPPAWAELEAQVLKMEPFAKQTKALARRLASQAAGCELDVQGRILLPARLRTAAGLEKEVRVVGVLTRIEVWSPDAWETFLRDSEHLLDDVSGLSSTGKL